MRDRALRAIAECGRIAAMTEEPGQITRRYLTPPVREVHALLSARMTALGMTTRVDAAGNLRGLWRSPHSGSRRLILGSHIDTVPNAGAFDGVLGVTLAIECVQLAQEMALPLDLETIAFSEEEGVRFGLPFIGSRAVADRFDSGLLALKDESGATLEAAIRAFGLDPGLLPEAQADSGAVGMFEIHIEQGPVLESEGLSVAAVTAIAGQTRLSLEFIGHANHAGTTPMHLRRDALAGAVEWAASVESIALNTEGLVATVGKIEVTPNAANVVPGSARLSLDIRHPEDSVRADAIETLHARAEAIAARRSLSFKYVRVMDQPAVPMDERLTAFMVDAIEACGFPPWRMPSGAGHDAMVMAARMPTAMLFLRSPGGVSHHPDESVLEEDVEAALHVAQKFLERLAADSQ